MPDNLNDMAKLAAAVAELARALDRLADRVALLEAKAKRDDGAMA